MRVIIGYGNSLRGEDAFGLDVIKELQKLTLKETKLLSAHQLTPEIVLELQDADEIIFIDTCHDEKNPYTLACSLAEQSTLNLSHHISPKTIIYMLKNLYDKTTDFYIYSMMSNSFESITDNKRYKEKVRLITNYLSEFN
ncbi:MAG: hydrogenase maturation protease [Sulfurimonas sp.]|jgi:hydrogenase maturation protease